MYKYFHHTYIISLLSCSYSDSKGLTRRLEGRGASRPLILVIYNIIVIYQVLVNYQGICAERAHSYIYIELTILYKHGLVLWSIGEIYLVRLIVGIFPFGPSFNTSYRIQQSFIKLIKSISRGIIMPITAVKFLVSILLTVFSYISNEILISLWSRIK